MGELISNMAVLHTEYFRLPSFSLPSSDSESSVLFLCVYICACMYYIHTTHEREKERERVHWIFNSYAIHPLIYLIVLFMTNYYNG